MEKMIDTIDRILCSKMGQYGRELQHVYIDFGSADERLPTISGIHWIVEFTDSDEEIIA